MAVDIGHHMEHHVYHVGIDHRLCVEVGVLLGIGTVCSKDEAGVLDRVSDPDPYWIRIQSDHWIRIRIQEGKNDPQK